jgi:DNA topoisomerase-1
MRAKTARLRRSRYDQPGIRRRRAGSGFAYYYQDGRRVTEVDVLARVKSLVLPPAWTDVWICPWPNGHVQALGTDAAGRRQYRYHDDWRLMRDAEKHERVLRMAAVLPAMRERVAADLAAEGLQRPRVLAAAVRLLDLGFFRVGGEAYADEHNTYGLATLRKSHVTLEPGGLVFEYDAKGGKHRVVTIIDPQVREVIAALKRRRGGGDELLAYKNAAGRWCDVRSTDVNGHLRELTGVDMTAKDFRTWHATVLMAVALAVSDGAVLATEVSPLARERIVARDYREVAGYLGNTPAVCRKSYVDPLVVERFEEGETIAADLGKLGADASYGLATHGAIERAVVRLLRRGVPRAVEMPATFAG